MRWPGMPELRMRCFCKVNLCLEVLGRRADGYHELRTVFQTVSLADELALEVPGSDIEVSVPGGGAPAGPDNLCWQAAAAYRRARGWPEGVRIELRKHVPAGAGLGGGSSNAAGVLTGLAALDRQPPAESELLCLAAELGSDVAFFVKGGTALGRGRGEQLQALPTLSDCWLVLARPDLAIPTAEAYALLAPQDFTEGARAEAMADVLRRGGSAVEAARHVYNSFTRPLVERWPQMAELTGSLARAGALAAAISGSGSAAFGLFTEAEAASAAAEELVAEGLWATVTRPTECASQFVHNACGGDVA